MAEFTFRDQAAQTMFRSSREPLLICSREGTVLAVNASARGLLGIGEVNGLIGQEVRSILSLGADHWEELVRDCDNRLHTEAQFYVTKSSGDQFSAEGRFLALDDCGVLIGLNPVEPENSVHPQLGQISSTEISSELVIRALQYQQMYQDNAQLANTDSLTGADNRRSFDSKLSSALADTSIQGAPLSLLVIDADNFKRLNDGLGHQEGDVALQGLVRVIRKCVRSVDTVGRVGGEEFGVLLPATDRDKAMEVAERIRFGVETTVICAAPVTISIGVATATGPAAHAETLFAEADSALYRSKDAGRNRVTHADEPPTSVDQAC